MGNSHSAGNGDATTAIDNISQQQQQQQFGTPMSIRFHSKTAENVQVSSDGKTARRVRSYKKGSFPLSRRVFHFSFSFFSIKKTALVFSRTAIPVGTPIVCRIDDFSTQWSGSIRLGFTRRNPASLSAEELSKFLCPDLVDTCDFFGMPVREDLVTLGTVLFFMHSSSGHLLYGVNGAVNITQGCSGIDTSGPLWAVIDIYGQTMQIELLGKKNVPRIIIPRTMQNLDKMIFAK